MLKSVNYFLMLCMVSLQVACGWDGESEPSVILIALESAKADAINCDQVTEGSGFALFCRESIQFSQAYTSSLMSQATLSSVFTAKYPFELNIWHNGSQFLSAQHETTAELAVVQGYRTAFFSGGPPIWSKSGLRQGFEIFDDSVRVREDYFFRPMSENFSRFLAWLDRGGSSPFFATIFLADFQFQRAKTRNESGVERGLFYESQVEELDESLKSLIGQLKRRKLWNSSYVILAGLNGYSEQNRPGELAVTSLYSENTRVPLIIKPPQKVRDSKNSWKINQNVSLVDLGLTLREILNRPTTKPAGAKLKVISLLESLKSPEVAWEEERNLLIETGWPQWRGVGNSRFAVRRGKILFINDQKPKLYNTLIDRLETSQVLPEDLRSRTIYEEMSGLFKSLSIEPWRGLSPYLFDKLKLAEVFFEGPVSDEKVLELDRLVRKHGWDSQLLGWYHLYLIEKKEWKKLKRSAEKHSISSLVLLAQEKLGEKLDLIKSGCEQFYTLRFKGEFPWPSPKVCDDRVFLNLVAWRSEPDKKKRSKDLNLFLSGYSKFLIKKRIAKMNYANGLKWEVPVDIPGEVTHAELYLNLDRHQKLKRKIGKRINLNQ